VIVGSALRANGKAGGSIDLELARRFAEAYSLERRTSE
jgi:predicted TIM-barrel enzyme